MSIIVVTLKPEDIARKLAPYELDDSLVKKLQKGVSGKVPLLELVLTVRQVIATAITESSDPAQRENLLSKQLDIVKSLAGRQNQDDARRIFETNSHP